MGLLEKMKTFLKRKPTPAEQELIDKNKVDMDRVRMEGIRARIEAAGAFPHGRVLMPEEEEEIKPYFKEAVALTENVAAAAFDVTGIDRNIEGIVQILENAVRQDGSKKTILRCFQGIAYGLINAHGPISENAIEVDVVQKRIDNLFRYLRIAQCSFEVDQKQRDVSRKLDKKRVLEMSRDDTLKEIKEFSDVHPGAYEDLKKLIPSERAMVTGDMKHLAGLMDRAVEQQENIRRIDLMIGESQMDINTLESMNDMLFAQQQNAESEIDEQSIADVERLTKAFERDMLKQRELMGQVDQAIDHFDKAIEEMLAGLNTAENLVVIDEAYEKMLKEIAMQEEHDKAARLSYEERMEAYRQEAHQKLKNDNQTQEESNSSQIYYN